MWKKKTKDCCVVAGDIVRVSIVDKPVWLQNPRKPCSAKVDTAALVGIAVDENPAASLGDIAQAGEIVRGSQWG